MSNQEMKENVNPAQNQNRSEILEAFEELRQSVPSLRFEQNVPPSVILMKSIEYIKTMRGLGRDHQTEIKELEQQNQEMEKAVLLLEGIPRAVPIASTSECEPAMKKLKLEEKEAQPKN